MNLPPTAETPEKALTRISGRIAVMRRKAAALNPEIFGDEHAAILRRIADHQRGYDFLAARMKV